MTTKNKPTVSIVIPAYNEEKYLPKLLESIKAQNFKNYEIIVADARSKDKTRKIAKKFGAKVIDGGLPAVGRNKGAKAAKGDYILFLDSDGVLPENFLEGILNEFEQRNLGIAYCNPLPLEGGLKNMFFLGLMNLFNTLSQYVKPFGGGYCLLVKKSLHNQIKGFDENLVLGEDVDYIQRFEKIAKYAVLKERFYLSMRRFIKDGWVKTLAKYVIVCGYMLFNKEAATKVVKNKKIKYELDYKKS